MEILNKCRVMEYLKTYKNQENFSFLPVVEIFVFLKMEGKPINSLILLAMPTCDI